MNGYLASALKLELEPDELVENLYFRTVCRPPTPEELSKWSAELKQASSRLRGRRGPVLGFVEFA